MANLIMAVSVILLGICAFVAPAPRAPSVGRSAVSMASLAEIKADSGVSAPFGYFDPLGLMGSPGQQEKYSLFKEAEIKHARVAMLAAPGFLIGEQFHPLFDGNIDVPSLVAFQATPLQNLWPVVLIVIGAIEGRSSVSTYKSPMLGPFAIKEGHLPGDLGLFAGKEKARKDPAGFKEIQTKELNNGRLAMMAIAGMVVQELLFGAKLL